MQETRRHILEILKARGQATVDDLVEQLYARNGKRITAVTVRHHLNILQQDGYVTEPELRRRSQPGRPQNLYTLTAKASEVFPNNYAHLINTLIAQLNQQLPDEQINVVLEGVADHMAAQACIPDVPLAQRMDMVVTHLNAQGYDACWEASADGYLLHTQNCPYHQVSQCTDALCVMDLRLISALIGCVPRRLTRISDGDQACTYLIPRPPE